MSRASSAEGSGAPLPLVETDGVPTAENRSLLYRIPSRSVPLADADRRNAAVGRRPVLVPVRDGRPVGDVVKAMDARSLGVRGAQMERVRQMRSCMKPVDR